MTESEPARLGSSHLEDMAAIALLARPNSGVSNFYPVLDEVQRIALRTRLKKISRYNWPATMKDDGQLRRGYTLRQCLRLVVALQLIDGHLAASIAVPIAAHNELATMRIIVNRLQRADPATSDEDQLAVVALGELWEPVDPPAACAATLPRMRIIERGALSALWANQTDLDFPGQRLVIDIGSAAVAVWTWMTARRLIPRAELNRLVEDVRRSADIAGYSEVIIETTL
jgi:hypothetical protein